MMTGQMSLASSAIRLMMKVISMDAVARINEVYAAFHKRFSELDTMKGEYDMQEQDILHYIEFEKYDAATGSKLLKRLKEIRIGRREIKNEYEDLQSILRRLNNAGLKNYKRKQKKYTYRTVTISSIPEEYS